MTEEHISAELQGTAEYLFILINPQNFGKKFLTVWNNSAPTSGEEQDISKFQLLNLIRQTRRTEHESLRQTFSNVRGEAQQLRDVSKSNLSVD